MQHRRGLRVFAGKGHTGFYAVGVSIIYLSYLVAVENLSSEELIEFIFETRIVSFPERIEAAQQMRAAYDESAAQ